MVEVVSFVHAAEATCRASQGRINLPLRRRLGRDRLGSHSVAGVGFSIGMFIDGPMHLSSDVSTAYVLLTTFPIFMSGLLVFVGLQEK